MTYETGIFVAFLAWLWLSINAIISLNSRMQRNLNKIGQRLSWLSMTPKPISADEESHGLLRKIFKFLFLYGTGLPFVLGGWFYVLYVIGIIIYRKSKDAGSPQVVREFRWKLRNTDMSFDQLVKELVKVGELEPFEFERVKAELIAEMKERGLRPSY